jgi:cell division protein FtsB
MTNENTPTPMTDTAKWAMENKPLTPREEELITFMRQCETTLRATVAELTYRSKLHDEAIIEIERLGKQVAELTKENERVKAEAATSEQRVERMRETLKALSKFPIPHEVGCSHRPETCTCHKAKLATALSDAPPTGWVHVDSLFVQCLLNHFKETRTNHGHLSIECGCNQCKIMRESYFIAEARKGVGQ